MPLWDDEIEALRPQLAEEAAMMVAAWPREDDDPSAPVEQRVATLRSSSIGGEVLADRAVDRTIDGPHGAIRLRTFVPDQPAGVYLHLHGGGFIMGDPEMMDQLNAILVDALNVAVVSVDYRLAPEHPYPKGIDDCEAAAVWLLEHAAAEYGTDRVLIGGESAGAYFSAATLLRVRDRHDAADRFAGANLVFGIYDVGHTPSQLGVSVSADRDVLTPEQTHFFCELYTPGMTIEQRRDPDVSPLYADLRGMPPAMFTVGTADHLLDDTLFMASRWEVAGNDTELLVYPEGPHGCMMMPSVASHWFPRMLDFLGRCLKG